MDDESEVGPFRTPELTEDALRAREREASWARVQRVTEAQIRAERRRAARGDTLVWVGLFGTVLALGAVVALAMVDPRGPWGPLICPASALALSALVAVVQRARWRRRRPPKP